MHSDLSPEKHPWTGQHCIARSIARQPPSSTYTSMPNRPSQRIGHIQPAIDAQPTNRPCSRNGQHRPKDQASNMQATPAIHGQPTNRTSSRNDQMHDRPTNRSSKQSRQQRQQLTPNRWVEQSSLTSPFIPAILNFYNEGFVQNCGCPAIKAIYGFV